MIILSEIQKFLDFVNAHTIMEQIEISIISAIAIVFLYNVYMIPFRVKKMERIMKNLDINMYKLCVDNDRATSRILQILQKNKEEK